MAAAGTLGVEGVDGAPLEGGDGGLDEAGFVERVGVDRNLHVHLVGHGRQQSIAAGVVPQSSCSFKPQAPARTCSRRARAGWHCPCPEANIDRPGFHRLQHPADVPGARSAGRGSGAGGRAGAAAEDGGQAGRQRLVEDLRADEVDVGVDAARGDDLGLAGDRLGAGADDDVDAGLGVGVAGLADRDDPPVLDADVRLDNTPVVEDDSVGNDEVDRAGGAGLLLCPMPSRMTLPPPKVISSP